MPDLGFPDNVDLGTVRVGEPATATLKWDHANNAFVWRIVKTITTPHVVERIRGYALPDDTPPAGPVKALAVRSFAPNCENGDSFAAMDVRIDNVAVNASALP
jgi:hypothetical protein